jgi:hypothetical protein
MQEDTIEAGVLSTTMMMTMVAITTMLGVPVRCLTGPGMSSSPQRDVAEFGSSGVTASPPMGLRSTGGEESHNRAG